ncbi:MAG: TetR/AcrR family transcriptional regulator [Actinomycetota bacterium]
MPKLWSQTVEAHRHEVRDAIQAATARLVSEQGVRSVTMSRIAQETGIGRATLYKYFPNVESILRAWHERRIDDHLQELVAASENRADPFDRLAAVLNAYGLIAHGSRGHRDTELASLMHGHHEGHDRAERQLRQLLRKVLYDAIPTGKVRDDVAVDELVEYCLHSLSAAGRLTSKPAVRRLVDLTIAGLQPPK